MFPSERRNADGGSRPVTADAFASDWPPRYVSTYLPSRGTFPHLLRHFAASDLYITAWMSFHTRILGHCWINATMIYVHVDRTRIENVGPTPAVGPLSAWEADPMK